MSTQETLIQDINSCTVKGNIVSLPPQSQPLNDYGKLKKALTNAGGIYKRNTFIFASDAQPFIDRLTGGEKVNIKKEFQSFNTPSNMADWLVELACMDGVKIVCEPSAGQGAIIHAILRAYPHCLIDCFELMPKNVTVLRGLKNTTVLDYNFITTSHKIGLYDRIIANPPFSKNQDIEHIRKMYGLLRENGRLVSVASKHWQTSKNKKETDFRNWLDEKSAAIHEIEAGGFKESGTMVSTCVIVIDK